MKKLAIALVLGAIVFSAAYAAAATLGLDTDDLGAGDDIVSSCTGPGAASPGNDVLVTYDTAFDTDENDYRVTNFHLTNITAACMGQTLKVTIVVDPAGDSSAPAEITGPIGTAPLANITSGDLQIDVTAFDLRAEDIVHIAVVITGDQP